MAAIARERWRSEQEAPGPSCGAEPSGTRPGRHRNAWDPTLAGLAPPQLTDVVV